MSSRLTVLPPPPVDSAARSTLVDLPRRPAPGPYRDMGCCCPAGPRRV